MNYLKKLEAQGGWIEYCECNAFIKQSDPQDNSFGKTVIITQGTCPACENKALPEATAEPVKESNV